MIGRLLFGVGMVLSFVASGMVCRVWIWPRIQGLPLPDAVRPILYLHVFRFVGASFLIPGIAGPDLPRAFAVPAAYGDLGAVALAWLALAVRRGPGLRAALWLFNLWGATDLLLALYQGVVRLGIEAGSFGGGFWIVFLYVPLLLCTHAVVFVLLLRRVPAGR